MKKCLCFLMLICSFVIMSNYVNATGEGKPKLTVSYVSGKWEGSPRLYDTVFFNVTGTDFPTCPPSLGTYGHTYIIDLVYEINNELVVVGTKTYPQNGNWLTTENDNFWENFFLQWAEDMTWINNNCESYIRVTPVYFVESGEITIGTPVNSLFFISNEH